jgi:RNA polymerase sigma factor (sigma-70 family)
MITPTVPPPEQLLRRAADGDEQAWSALGARFGKRLHLVARAHRLTAHDVDDVVQTTWLRLLEHLDRIRDPRSLGAWLATTARHECLRVLAAGKREVPTDSARLPDEADARDHDEGLPSDECKAALRQALQKLPERQRTLMQTLVAEPAPSYGEISRKLQMPIGSIGPTRARSLDRLRFDEGLVRALAADGPWM